MYVFTQYKNTYFPRKIKLFFGRYLGLFGDFLGKSMHFWDKIHTFSAEKRFFIFVPEKQPLGVKVLCRKIHLHKPLFCHISPSFPK